MLQQRCFSVGLPRQRPLQSPRNTRTMHVSCRCAITFRKDFLHVIASIHAHVYHTTTVVRITTATDTSRSSISQVFITSSSLMLLFFEHLCFEIVVQCTRKIVTQLSTFSYGRRSNHRGQCSQARRAEAHLSFGCFRLLASIETRLGTLPLQPFNTSSSAHSTVIRLAYTGCLYLTTMKGACCVRCFVYRFR